MRITNNIISRQSLEGIQRNLAAMEEAQRRVTSGLRIEKPSDDPAGALGILGADRRLSALDQYGRNIGSAASRLAAEETVLDSVTGILERARSLAVSQATGTATAQTRAITKIEVDQLLSEAIALGNTQFGGAYLFGGQFADAAPFDANGATSTARPPTGSATVENHAGQQISVQHDAIEVFVDTEALAALQDLSAGLGADDTAAIGSALTRLDTAHTNVQNVLGETGANVNQLEVAKANIDSLGVTLRTFRSDLSEVEMEEAISKLVTRQTAFQAALAATSRMISLTLTDYLR
ncbi:MAG: flagellar hook-associated protein FlgL [Longimicrobiales bacterium]